MIFDPKVAVGVIIVYLLDGRTDLRAVRSLEVRIFYEDGLRVCVAVRGSFGRIAFE